MSLFLWITYQNKKRYQISGFISVCHVEWTDENMQHLVEREREKTKSVRTLGMNEVKTRSQRWNPVAFTFKEKKYVVFHTMRLRIATRWLALSVF